MEDFEFVQELEAMEIPCIPVSETRCSAVITQATLLKIAPDPRALEDRKKGAAELDVDAQKARDLRAQMQRLFENEKKRNAVQYTTYLADTRGRSGERKRDGFAPPISLFSGERLRYTTRDGQPAGPGKPCFVAIPSDRFLVAFDGDTQLAARHALQRKDPATKYDHVAVTIVHGESLDYAKQAFHDVNAYGVKVSKSLALAMDTSDPLTRLTKQLVKRSPLLTDRVENVKATLRDGDKAVITLSTLQMAVKAFIGGINKASFKMVYSEELVSSLEVYCFDWFEGLFQRFEAAFNDRVNTVITTQAVMVAIGALGRKTYPNELNDHTSVSRQGLLDSLASVDWSRDERWADIALAWAKRRDGSTTLIAPNGHNHWRNTYEALSNPESPIYAKIRTKPTNSGLPLIDSPVLRGSAPAASV